MNTATYNALSPDIRAEIGPIVLDDAIPDGQVRVTSASGTHHQVPINAFVRKLRRAHKAERQNRKRGRR